eukprot:TRINITY_DN74165_c0_g1_i1.p1 TRINITY_DN74165_c0_g1~~TRINITY_DN74165_c0_g1_i1.p1  ORF type:complete len:813 (+),score=156.37 TRINITY_DN74165_c0_g1_i1:269-2707(+)
MAESSTRFAHLLQPIKDLSKVWKIDIADELETYIEEVSRLMLANPEAGVSQLNFAEAALLIQGSTAIYSRKVEQLHQLVFQALDMLSLKKDAAAGKRGSRASTTHSGLWGPIPETEELLTIDHLMREGRNLLLESGAGGDTITANEQRRQAMQRRMPLFLMPRDQADGPKREHRISSCSVHDSGVYLLQESDGRLLDEILAKTPASHPLGDSSKWDDFPKPLAEVHGFEERLEELLKETPVEPAPCPSTALDETQLPSPEPVDEPSALVEVPVPGEAETPKALETESVEQAVIPPPEEDKGPWQSAFDVPFAGDDETALVANSSELLGPDPWEPLNEHELAGKDVPLEVGKTGGRVNKKRLVVPAEKLPDASAWEIPSDAALWDSAFGGGVTGKGADQSDVWRSGLAPLAAGHPVESLFLAVAGSPKGAGARSEVQKAGFSNAWLEFEDLFVASNNKRRAVKLLSRFSGIGAGTIGNSLGSPGGVGEAVNSGIGASDDEGPPTEDVGAPSMATSTAEVPPSPKVSVSETDPDPSDRISDAPPLSQELDQGDPGEHRREVAALENMIQEAQQKYESTVRQHLMDMQKDLVDASDRKYPQLYANVQRWQDQLAPVLRENEARPVFNVQRYSADLLSQMAEYRNPEDEIPKETLHPVVPFSHLVQGLSRWEVCRRFLTCLLLTNQGNTDILFDTEQERLNDFRLKLIKVRRLSISFNQEDGEDKENDGIAARPRKAPRLSNSAARSPADASLVSPESPMDAIESFAAATPSKRADRMRSPASNATRGVAAAADVAAPSPVRRSAKNQRGRRALRR